MTSWCGTPGGLEGVQFQQYHEQLYTVDGLGSDRGDDIRHVISRLKHVQSLKKGLPKQRHIFPLPTSISSVLLKRNPL